MLTQDPQSKKQMLLGLKKSRGTIQKVIDMIESEEGYCVDIATQVNAAIGSLKSVNTQLLESHLLTCGATSLTSSNTSAKSRFVKELIRAWQVTTR